MNTKRILTLALLFCIPARAENARFEKDSTLPLVYLNWVVKAGATNDPEGMDGLTNVMAELLTRGTKKKSKKTIDEAIDRMGAELDIETRAEAVILRGTVLSSEWRKFADLLGEIVTEPSFPADEFARLKREAGGKALDRLSNDSEFNYIAVEKLLFGSHPYGKVFEGTPSSLARITLAAAQTQYEKLFRKGRLILVGSGDADPEEIGRYAHAITERLPYVDGDDTGMIPSPQEVDRRRVVLIDRPGRTQTQIRFGQIGMTMKDPRFFPYQIANQAFGGSSFSSKLMSEIREKRGWSYGAYASPRYGTLPREWIVNLFPAVKDTPQALELALKLSEEFAASGLTREEFDEAKEGLLQSVAFQDDTARKRVENAILEETLSLPRGFMSRQAEGIRSVSYEKANEAAKSFVKPGRFAIAIVGTKELREPVARAAGVTPGDVRVYTYPEYGE